MPPNPFAPRERGTHPLGSVEFAPAVPVNGSIGQVWRLQKNTSKAFPSLPLEKYSCLYDKHTQKGKAMGRGMDHFYAEGAKLENHDPQPGEDYYTEQSAKSWGWRRDPKKQPASPDIPGLFD